MKTIGTMLMLGLLLFAGCTREDSILVQNETANQGRIRIYLTDSPALFDAVNIVVTRVEVHRAGADSTSGWITIDSTTRTYNLLALTNGASAVLGDGTLEVGKYTQIRLIIGEGSTVDIGGVLFQLKIPGGMQTGIKLVHQFEIQPDALYELMLDFDASRSIHKDGPGTYILRPVIRAEPVQTSGSISGTVLPVAAHAWIWTMVGSDTVAAYADTTSGYFKIIPLPGAASYNLHFSPGDTTYRDSVLTGVVVVARQNTHIGTMTLQLK